MKLFIYSSKVIQIAIYSIQIFNLTRCEKFSKLGILEPFFPALCNIMPLEKRLVYEESIL